MAQSLVASPSLFGDLSVDHAVAGLGAGTVATLVMHPLDLVKVRFQLAGSFDATLTSSSSSSASPMSTPGPSTYTPTSTSTFKSGSSSAFASPSAFASISTAPSTPVASTSTSTSTSSPASTSSYKSVLSNTRRKPMVGTAVYRALEEAVVADGWKGLYRGLIPNLVGGASSWGLYFLFYNMIKKRMQGDDPDYRTSSGQHLLAAAEASAVTAMLTNPIWVVKTRVFATGRSDPAYRGLFTALRTIYTREGIRGLYKGSLLALVGVSNGSIQFATYEALKRRRTDLKRKRYESRGREWRTEDGKLTNAEYILASGWSKLVAIALTYPYQVVRARIQNSTPSPSLPRLTIPSVIASTYRHEGVLAFYKGLGTNALRILPGTCTTFVVYENLVWAFRALAVRREKERDVVL